ncbi:unnamed protein product [Paramecium sonneborni]|uniref:Uncharacterized protein n=1 Tax=Paramecium sonneborni TaxID=65129 RepID=A0A8S1KBK7_9CILI|nr:unnamed protein product [Paramecium sonneborni]
MNFIITKFEINQYQQERQFSCCYDYQNKKVTESIMLAYQALFLYIKQFIPCSQYNYMFLAFIYFKQNASSYCLKMMFKFIYQKRVQSQLRFFIIKIISYDNILKLFSTTINLSWKTQTFI